MSASVRVEQDLRLPFPASVLLRLGDLATDGAADRRTGRYSRNAAAGDITRDATCNGAGGGAFLLRCHRGATARNDRKGCRNCAG